MHSTFTRSCPSQATLGHWSGGAKPRRIFTPMTTSSTVTVPLPSQSPTHGRSAGSTACAAARCGAKPVTQTTASNVVTTTRRPKALHTPGRAKRPRTQSNVPLVMITLLRIRCVHTNVRCAAHTDDRTEVRVRCENGEKMVRPGSASRPKFGDLGLDLALGWATRRWPSAPRRLLFVRG